MAISQTQLQSLYLAYFGRPADFDGTVFYTSNPSFDIWSVAAAFSASPESQALYGTGVAPNFISAATINAIYQNLFNRDAEPAGLAYWAGEVASGRLTAGGAAYGIFLGAQNEDKVAVANKMAASAAFTAALDTAPEIIGYSGDDAAAAARAWLATVTADPATLTAALAGVDAAVAAVVAIGGPAGETFTLTAGLDTIVGTTGNDTVNANFATALGALDSINGDSGKDTLNVFGVDSLGVPAAISISAANVTSVEILNLSGASTVSADTSGWTGLQELNVVQSAGSATITAGDTTAVSVANAAAAVTVVGGSTQNVAIDTAGGAITLSDAAGAVQVTVSAQGTQTITIDDGTSVNLSTAAKFAGVGAQGAITIGGTSSPTGAVTVTNALTGNTVGGTTGGDIEVYGGTTVSVTSTATQPVKTTAGANQTVSQGYIYVEGSTDTTSVTLTQTASVTAVATTLAVAAVTETGSATFVALTAGQTLEVGGLTFTAGAAGTTAAQTAAAFANLSAGATQGSSALGTYSGTLSGWTSGAASTATVVFTSTVAGGVTDLAFAGTGTWPTLSLTQGVAAVEATGKGGIAANWSWVDDANYSSTTVANTITTVNVNGYADGSGVYSNALTNLSLANSDTNAWFYVGVNNAAVGYASSLALSVDNLAAGSNVYLDDWTAAYTSLSITTGAKKSAADVTANAVTALSVAGSSALDLTGSSFAALKTVTVSGAAGVTLDASGATVTSVDASASSGANTVTIDATKATYLGGSGADKVTVTAGISKAIHLGGGDDTLIVSTGVATAVVSGGDGTDTLQMDAASAVTASGSVLWATSVQGFEKLAVTGATGAQAIDLAQLGNYAYVSSNASAGTLTLNKMASGGTLQITGDTAVTGYVVNVTDATTGTADVVNLQLSKGTALAAGTVTATKVESINIVATDTAATTIDTHTLTLAAVDATSVTISGNAGLVLTNTGNVKLTSIDGSAMTGALTVTAAGTVAETITGGSGNDVLTASTGTVADVLIGGAGNDVLTANAGLTTLTGGAGADVFVAQAASANVNTYATITDASSGDTIVLVDMGTETFNRTKLTLGDTAVFQDYANLAAAGDGSANGAISWFQFGGNTYIVEDLSVDASFDNGTDIVVKLTGLIDLSTVGLSTTFGETLLIA